LDRRIYSKDDMKAVFIYRLPEADARCVYSIAT